MTPSLPSRYRTGDFAYPLPESLIAQTPTRERGASRLLVVRPEAPTEARLDDATFAGFPELLAPGDLLVRNTTRVRHARLLGRRPSGRPAEVLLLHPGADQTWIAIGKPGSALRPGKQIALDDALAVETVALLDGGERVIRFVGGTADDAIRRHGRLPLPPYVSREPDARDEVRYQTIYAEREGSVAAPTAGLHFTTELLEAVTRQGAAIADLDLEVGPGTFKPVEADEPTRHPMHPERYTIPEATVAAIARARQAGGRIWAVGTTVVRALESAADGDTLLAGTRETRLLIVPGYSFSVVDALLTNFHLPRSTLLMLVCAFGGYETVMTAYRHAVARGYRFYSYGDAMAVTSRAAA